LVDKATEHERRKDAQLRICLDNDVQSRDITTGLERYRLVHQALPEIDWEEIDLSVSLLGKRLRAPVLISPMTGGCGLGARVNRHLAEAAQRLGLAMGVGVAADCPRSTGLWRADTGCATWLQTSS